jgi:hypothetical protein
MPVEPQGIYLFTVNNDGVGSSGYTGLNGRIMNGVRRIYGRILVKRQ